MDTYKVIFTLNTITSIKKKKREYHFEGDSYYYTNDKGFLVHAIIKAETEADAKLKAYAIIEKVTKI
jgi:hypothetical protein